MKNLNTNFPNGERLATKRLEFDVTVDAFNASEYPKVVEMFDMYEKCDPFMLAYTIDRWGNDQIRVTAFHAIDTRGDECFEEDLELMHEIEEYNQEVEKQESLKEIEDRMSKLKHSIRYELDFVEGFSLMCICYELESCFILNSLNLSDLLIFDGRRALDEELKSVWEMRDTFEEGLISEDDFRINIRLAYYELVDMMDKYVGGGLYE